jgi:hypothetical protein
MTTPIGWAASDGGTAWAAASWSTSLLSLTTGAMTLGPAIDNTPATIGAAAYTEGVLQIDLGSATTLGASGFPTLLAVPLDALDGSDYVQAFNSGGQLYPLDRQRLASFPASASTRFIHVRGLMLLPALTKIAIVNNLGISLPASGVTATFYRLLHQAG